MAALFQELDHVETPMGELSLRRRRILSIDTDVLEVKLGEEFLMSSLFTAGERALAQFALAAHPGSDLDVVVGGLGLGYTAVAALKDPRVRSVKVIEALAPVIGWHRRGLVPLDDGGARRQTAAGPKGAARPAHPQEPLYERRDCARPTGAVRTRWGRCGGSFPLEGSVEISGSTAGEGLALHSSWSSQVVLMCKGRHPKPSTGAELGPGPRRGTSIGSAGRASGAEAQGESGRRGAFVRSR